MGVGAAIEARKDWKGAKDHGSGLFRQRREDMRVKMEGVSLEEPRSKKWVLARVIAQHQRSWWPVLPTSKTELACLSPAQSKCGSWVDST